MSAVPNPTVHMHNGKLWGFEFEHVIAATTVFILSNAILNSFDLPLIISWVMAGVVLLSLRFLSITKKSGYLGFLMAWILLPHLYLGSAKRKTRHGSKVQLG
jgi:hypothetical protein